MPGSAKSGRPHILVLGAGGQVGHELSRRVWLPALKVTSLSHAELDICEPGAVAAAIRQLRPSIIVNCAAYTAVDRAESEPQRAMAVNATAPEHLAQACAEAGAALIHLSTDYVFDGGSARPYVESDAVNPINVYGRTKEAGERRIRERLERHVILRTSWVYASHGRNFVETMLRLGAERRMLRIVADQRGCPTAAHEIAEAIDHVARMILDGSAPWGTYHFCGAGAATWYDFAAEIFAGSARHGGPQPELHRIRTEEYPTPAQRPKNSVLDCALAKERLGLAARPWQQSLSFVLEQIFAARSGEAFR